MGLYRHPHLTRGVIHTSEGAFSVNRGIVDLPDDLGETLGWEPVTSEGGIPQGPARGDDRARSAVLGGVMEPTAPR